MKVNPGNILILDPTRWGDRGSGMEVNKDLVLSALRLYHDRLVVQTAPDPGEVDRTNKAIIALGR